MCIIRAGCDGASALPASFAGDSVRVIGYPAHGSLTLHTDMYMGCTLSISLGSACRFVYGAGFDDGELVEPQRVTLASGDMVFFNGQKLPHGVEAIEEVRVDGTCWHRTTIATGGTEHLVSLATLLSAVGDVYVAATSSLHLVCCDYCWCRTVASLTQCSREPMSRPSSGGAACRRQ